MEGRREILVKLHSILVVLHHTPLSSIIREESSNQEMGETLFDWIPMESLHPLQTQAFQSISTLEVSSIIVKFNFF